MRRRSFLAASAVAAMAGGLARPSIAQPARVLKFIPHANLSSPDPVWTTSAIAFNHGNLVWDRLYALTEKLEAKPQMVGSDEVSADGLTWRIRLRDGLAFTDGDPVRSIDCITSLNRWAKRDGFGQRLMSQLDEMRVVDDKTFEIKLKKPFPVLRFAIAQGSSFIMPERTAKTDAFQQITEFIGSGPFRFLRDEWVSGSHAAYARNEKYVPRAEPIDSWSGGKVVHFDRLEWKIVPDSATQAAALQAGEVDWVDLPLFDLIPAMRRNANIRVAVNDPLGWIGIVQPNHLHPPFNNKKLRQALLHAISQQDFVDAVLGELKEYGKAGAGYFTPNTPNESKKGLEVMMGKRDIALAKKLVAESGYKGEKVVLMSPSDQPALTQTTHVVHQLFQKLGLNVDYQSMDWSTLVARRASREPPDKGGWNAFCTSWGGLSVSDPGGHFPMRGNGRGGWFGWPEDPKMETLRDAWLDAPDRDAQKKLAEEIQIYAMQQVPMIPTGQWFYPTATRDNVTDIVRSALMLHWGVKKG